MKKIMCVAAALATMSVPAFAQDSVIKPYVGVDYQYTDIDGKNMSFDGSNGANIHVGGRMDNFGLELGYFHTAYADGSIFGTDVGEVKTRGFTLDGLGYLPMTDDKSFELVGTLGVSHIRADVKLDPAVAAAAGVERKGHDSEWGFRAGAGAQYNINDQLNVRALARYQTADFDDVADKAWVYNVGLNYGF